MPQRLPIIMGKQRNAKQHGVSGHGGGEDVTMQDPDDRIQHAAGDGQQGGGGDVPRGAGERFRRLGLG